MPTNLQIFESIAKCACVCVRVCALAHVLVLYALACLHAHKDKCDLDWSSFHLMESRGPFPFLGIEGSLL